MQPSDHNLAKMGSNISIVGASTRRQNEHERSYNHSSSRTLQPRREERNSRQSHEDDPSGDYEPRNPRNTASISAMGPPSLPRQEIDASERRYPSRRNQERREQTTSSTLNEGKTSNISGTESDKNNIHSTKQRHPQQDHHYPDDRKRQKQHHGGVADQLLQKVIQERNDAVQECKDLVLSNDLQKAQIRIALRDLEKEKSRNNTDTSDSKNEQDRLEQELAEERKRTQSLEATIREFQAVQLKSVESTQWMPFAISDIQRQLEAIQAQIRQWAKKFSKMTFEEFMQSDDQRELILSLIDHKCIPSEERLLKALLDNQTMQKPGRASGLTLGAAVSIVVMICILDDPFFAFDGKDQEKYLLSGADGAALSSLTDHIRESK